MVRGSLLVTLAVLAGSSVAAAGRPHLQVKLVRGTTYAVAVSPEIASDRIWRIAAKIGRGQSSILGSSVEHRSYSRRPAKTARVTITLADEVRDPAGARLSRTETILRDRVTLPAPGQRTAARGPKGTLVVARPMFNFEVQPAGIPLADIEKVTFAWPQLLGETYAPRRETTIDPENPTMPTMRGYGLREPFPISAAVQLKTGKVLHLDAFVGPPAAP